MLAAYLLGGAAAATAAATAASTASAAAAPPPPDAALCRSYVAAHAKDTQKQPAGVLKFPYLVPAGPYEQCWDCELRTVQPPSLLLLKSCC